MELFGENHEAEFRREKQQVVAAAAAWKASMNEAICLLQPMLDGDLIREIGVIITPVLNFTNDFFKLDLSLVYYRNPGWLFEKLRDVTSVFLETVNKIHAEYHKCKKSADRDEQAYLVLKETFVWVRSRLPSAGP